MSDVDIEPGTRWSERIASQLQQSNFGIICVTPDNRSSEWVHFEAGALSIALHDTQRKVVPLLIGFEERGGLRTGPLSLFNAVRFVEEDMWKLVLTLNGELKPALDGSDLREIFDAFWPKLQADVQKLEARKNAPKPEKKTQPEMIEEILQTVQSMSEMQTLHYMRPANVSLDTISSGHQRLNEAIKKADEAMAKFRSSEKIPPEDLFRSLTHRQREIASLAAEGTPNEEIALLLGMSPHTVEGHLYEVYGELGIKSAAELALFFPPESAE